MSALSGRALTGVACGLAHTLAVDGEGSLLAWGANGYGQLGTGHACDHVASPCDAGAGMDGPVAHAACGAAHSVVVTAAGSVFATGSNSCGQLGVGDSTDRQSWTLVQILAPAAMAACGEEFTTFVTRDRAVFSCGLGSARGHETEIPAPVQGLPGDDAPALLACGRAQSVLITEGGQAFTWGCAHAQWGTPPRSPLPAPRPAADRSRFRPV